MNKEEIRELLYYGRDKGYTHMIIICDRWDYTYTTAYVSEEEDVEEVIQEKLSWGNLYSVTEIYNYGMDLEFQLGEYRANHQEIDMNHIVKEKVKTISK